MTRSAMMGMVIMFAFVIFFFIAVGDVKCER